MDDLLGVPNEKEKLAITAMMGMRLGRKVK